VKEEEGLSKGKGGKSQKGERGKSDSRDDDLIGVQTFQLRDSLWGERLFTTREGNLRGKKREEGKSSKVCLVSGAGGKSYGLGTGDALQPKRTVGNKESQRKIWGRRF